MQLLPDQTRAFFLARGFGREDADAIAEACVFQTIFRNGGSLPLAFDLDDRRIVSSSEHNHLLTRDRWDARWRHAKVKQAARIAMRWALLPTR